MKLFHCCNGPVVWSFAIMQDTELIQQVTLQGLQDDWSLQQQVDS